MSAKRATPEQRIQIRKLVRARQSIALISEMLDLPESEVRDAIRPRAPKPPPEGRET